ncbi:hypothetical protein [Aeromicrobium sp.]|uniref:hypothetical protein n=1 Tax=Aeromicrobium sp. TaxID=1871063 RepID=UPI0030C23F90
MSTDTINAPEATAPVKHDLTPHEPQRGDTVTYIEDSTPEPEPVDYFDTYGSLKAGETLQLLKALGVEESDLARTGTPQLVAVVWKHQRTTLGTSKISELLELTEKQLLAALNLTPEAYVKQVTDYIESGSKS